MHGWDIIIETGAVTINRHLDSKYAADSSVRFVTRC
jgi:hypothetical protein